MKKLLSLFWLLLFLLAAFAGLARAAVLFENTALDQAVQAAGRTLYSSLPFPAQVRYVAILRLVGLLACLAAGALVFFRSSPAWRAGLAGFTACLLAVLPHTNGLGAVLATPFPAPWLARAWELLNSLGILAALVSFFLLPTGLPPGRLRWIAITSLAATMLAVLLLLSGLLGDAAWFPVILLLLATLLLGVGWQGFRLRKRLPGRGVSLALVLLGGWTLFSGIFLGMLIGQNGAWVYVDIHARLLIGVFLALVLAQAVQEGGLWGSAPVPTRFLQPVLTRRWRLALAHRWRLALAYRWRLALALLGLLVLANLAWLGVSAFRRAPDTPQQALPPLPAGQRRVVVIDTDMGADDWMAILYLLKKPEIEVKAITVTGTGLARCPAGAENALRLVALAGSEPIPVACGRSTPLQGFHYFPGGWRDGSDRFIAPAPPPAANPAAGQDAVAVLSQALRSAPRPVVLLVTGPMTNLAEALQADPALKDRLEMIFFMGGAVDASGNMIEGGVDNAWAEWNVYIDPLAFQVVLDTGVPLTLVALDATNQAPATRRFVDRLAAQGQAPAADFVVRVLEGNPGLDVLFGYYFWDPLAAGLLADETLGRYQERRLGVVTAEGLQSGRLVETASGAPLRLAVWANRERFEQALIDAYRK